MTRYRIAGGRPLVGSVQLSGAKNAASKLIIASLLTTEPCEISHAPQIGETALALELVTSVGAAAQQTGDHVHVHAERLHPDGTPELSRKNRLPILAIGPLLHRTGQARVPRVGGDAIGARPVNYHLEALRAFGATIAETPDAVHASVNRLHGARIALPFPSVGATETVLLTGVLAEGITLLDNAAVEPEIRDLIRFLQQMGARIRFTADRSIEIEGVQTLRGATHTLIPDRLEAASFAAAAVATGGDVTLEGTSQDDLMAFLSVVEAMGGGVEIQDHAVRVWRTGPLQATTIDTAVYPGFATDWQQPAAVMLTQADGTSTIHETIYEDRLGYVDDLNRMGARIDVSRTCLGPPCQWAGSAARHSAVIHGATPLQATTVRIPDIRAGMAHIIAALTAPGESIVEQVEILDRGYEALDTKLRALGALVLRETV